MTLCVCERISLPWQMNTSVHHHTILVLGEEGNMSSLFLVSQVIHGVYLSLCAVPCDVEWLLCFSASSHRFAVRSGESTVWTYQRINEWTNKWRGMYVRIHVYSSILYFIYLFIYLEVCDYCVIPHCFVRLQMVAKDQTAPAMHGNTPVWECLNTFCRSLS